MYTCGQLKEIWCIGASYLLASEEAECLTGATAMCRLLPHLQGYLPIEGVYIYPYMAIHKP